MRQGIKEKDIRDFEKYAEKLGDVMMRIREYDEKAVCYVTMDEISLFGTTDLITGHYYVNNPPEAVATVIIPGLDSGEQSV